MQKPATGFSPKYSVAEIIGIFLSLSLLFVPQTATTFRAGLNGASILIVKAVPIEDIDKLVQQLPLTSDYLTAVNLYTNSQPPDKTVSGILGHEWINNQQDSSYSLQLLSASNADSLLHFCRQHKICGQSAQYQTKVNGKKIIRLLYGVYPNHKAAKLAKALLPDNLKKSSPWARQFKQIKQEL